MRILGIGDNVAWAYPEKKEFYPGGNALSVPVFAAESLLHAGYMGVVAEDAPGRHLLETLRSLDVDCSHCKVLPGESTWLELTLDDGEPIRTGESRKASTPPLEITPEDEDYIQTFDMVHTSCHSKLEEQLPQLHELGVPVSFDFTTRFDNEYLERVCPHIDIACLSCGDMEGKTIRNLIRRIHSYGPYLIVATRAAKGAMLSYNGMVYVQSPCLVQVVDSLGAGDAFLAAFLAGFFDNMQYCRDFPVEGGSRGIVRKEDYIDTSIRLSLSRAAAFAADNCLKEGVFGHGRAY